MASSSGGRPPPGAGAVARGFQLLSRARGARIFHPDGVGFAASLRPTGDREAAPLALAEPREAIVRLSRGLGLPEWLPDPCGLAVRVPDLYGAGLHQDFLLVTSGRPPLARHAISPSRGVLDRPYSSLLPYRVDGRLVVLGALPVGGPPGPRLAELRRREVAALEFDLATASPGGEWSAAARLSLGRRLPAEEVERLDFDPTNTGGGLELAGFLNRLRGPTYRASQAGREAAYRRGRRG